MFALDQVVPWGRSFAEYRRMFALDAESLQLRILGCADGPASFNSEATHAGASVVSVDPLYGSDAQTIRHRIDATFDLVLEQTRLNQERFVWDSISSTEELGRLRRASMETFLNDFQRGKHQGRYIEGELPTLPFADQSFDLALCSHFLFLYSEQFTFDFHLRAILELCRLADEARIFPLLALDGRPSQHVPQIVEALSASFAVSLERVPYEFQKGGNQMMRVRPLPKSRESSESRL